MTITRSRKAILSSQELNIRRSAVLVSAAIASLAFSAGALAAEPAMAVAPLAQINAAAAPAPIVTAPSIRPNVLVAPVPAGAANLAQSGATPASSAAPAQALEVPWVLPPELHPWPLRFNEQPPLNALYLDLPSEQEARLLLPGPAADAAQRVRAAVSKYINDAMGMAAQARGRQLEALGDWVTKTNQQQRQLTGDPWQAYEFSLESRRDLDRFNENVTRQTEPGLRSMAEAIQQAIPRIAPLVNVMPTYELRMAWYDIMVQLKEGLKLYQTQTAAADQQLLRQLEDFSATHPAVPRPAGDPPPQRSGPAAAQAAAPAATPVPAVSKVPEPEAVKAPPPSSGSSMGGLIVVGGILLSLAGVVFKFRRKINKGSPAKVEPT